jgi:hypothetical protein
MSDDLINLFQNLIVYYLERQKLVVLAMIDVQPLVLTMKGADIPAIDLQPYIDRVRHKDADGTRLYFGVWKNDWKYRLHGIGCELIHIQTKEPLEWDAPNSEKFRFEWFWEHLLWRSRYETDDPFVSKIIIWMKDKTWSDVFDILTNEKLIDTDIDGKSSLTIA